jgi:hypothetical protein
MGAPAKRRMGEGGSGDTATGRALGLARDGTIDLYDLWDLWVICSHKSHRSVRPIRSPISRELQNHPLPPFQGGALFFVTTSG